MKKDCTSREAERRVCPRHAARLAALVTVRTPLYCQNTAAGNRLAAVGANLVQLLQLGADTQLFTPEDLDRRLADGVFLGLRHLSCLTPLCAANLRKCNRCFEAKPEADAVTWNDVCLRCQTGAWTVRVATDPVDQWFLQNAYTSAGRGSKRDATVEVDLRNVEAQVKTLYLDAQAEGVLVCSPWSGAPCAPVTKVVESGGFDNLRGPVPDSEPTIYSGNYKTLLPADAVLTLDRDGTPYPVDSFTVVRREDQITHAPEQRLTRSIFDFRHHSLLHLALYLFSLFVCGRYELSSQHPMYEEASELWRQFERLPDQKGLHKKLTKAGKAYEKASAKAAAAADLMLESGDTSRVEALARRLAACQRAQDGPQLGWKVESLATRRSFARRLLREHQRCSCCSAILTGIWPRDDSVERFWAFYGHPSTTGGTVLNCNMCQVAFTARICINTGLNSVSLAKLILSASATGKGCIEVVEGSLEDLALQFVICVGGAVPPSE